MDGGRRVPRRYQLARFASITESSYASVFKAGGWIWTPAGRNWKLWSWEWRINKSCNVTSSARCTLMFTGLTMMLHIDSRWSSAGESSSLWIECSLARCLKSTLKFQSFSVWGLRIRFSFVLQLHDAFRCSDQVLVGLLPGSESSPLVQHSCNSVGLLKKTNDQSWSRTRDKSFYSTRSSSFL